MKTVEFYDAASERFMKVEDWFDHGPWLFYKHPDGQWVSVREATEDDLKAVAQVSRRMP